MLPFSDSLFLSGMKAEVMHAGIVRYYLKEE